MTLQYVVPQGGTAALWYLRYPLNMRFITSDPLSLGYGVTSQITP